MCRICKGDKEALADLFHRYARAVRAVTYRVLRDTSEADDLLQETFYRFLRAAATHDNESHRRNSLYRIATNLAKDARRRSLIRAPFSLPSTGIERVASSDGGDRAERTTAFTHAMSHLKPRERAMLWLAYAEGASHREIADALGLRPGSLKPLLFRARRRLASLLGGKVIDGSEAGNGVER